MEKQNVETIKIHLTQRRIFALMDAIDTEIKDMVKNCVPDGTSDLLRTCSEEYKSLVMLFSLNNAVSEIQVNIYRPLSDDSDLSNSSSWLRIWRYARHRFSVEASASYMGLLVNGDGLKPFGSSFLNWVTPFDTRIFKNSMASNQVFPYSLLWVFVNELDTLSLRPKERLI